MFALNSCRLSRKNSGLRCITKTMASMTIFHRNTNRHGAFLERNLTSTRIFISAMDVVCFSLNHSNYFATYISIIIAFLSVQLQTNITSESCAHIKMFDISVIVTSIRLAQLYIFHNDHFPMCIKWQKRFIRFSGKWQDN